jgi:hypothetical protein
MERQHVPPAPILSSRDHPYDFWLFVAVKYRMKDLELNLPEQIARRVGKLWDTLSFNEVQRVFEEWTRRLE